MWADWLEGSVSNPGFCPGQWPTIAKCSRSSQCPLLPSTGRYNDMMGRSSFLMLFMLSMPTLPAYFAGTG
eukprot:13149076-Heterocapsa_arctica.AAC.1